VIAMVSPEADTDTLSNHEGKLTVTDASTSLP